MGVKVSDLLQETSHTDLQVGGSAVGLEARVFPEPLSTEEWEQVKQLPTRAFYVEILSRRLAGWDLVDGKGKPLPITLEAIERARLPIKFLEMVHRAITEAEAAGKGSASSSPAGSPPAET